MRLKAVEGMPLPDIHRRNTEQFQEGSGVVQRLPGAARIGRRKYGVEVHCCLVTFLVND
jgi:hypothetical protein